MGGEKQQEAPKPVNPDLAREVVGRHLGKPNQAFLDKQRALSEGAALRAAKERKVELKEGKGLPDLISLVAARREGEKGLASDDESCCLTNDERVAYCQTVDQCVDQEATTAEDKDALRTTMTEVIFKPKVFRIHYHEWQEQWSSSPQLQAKYPEFKDYVLDRAKAFIAARRNEVIAARLRKFKGVSPEKAEEDTQMKEIIKKTLSFVREHQEELLEYTSLSPDDPKRSQLFKKFLAAADIPADKAEAARQLFQDIINDIEVAFTAQKKLEARHEIMIAMADDETIGDEEWDKKLEEADKKNQFLKEAMEQQQAPVYGAGAVETAGGRTLNAPSDVALEAGGLLYKPGSYDPVTNTCTFYSAEQPGFEIKVTIVPKKGSKNWDDAQFIFHDDYKGSDVTVNKGTLRMGSNRLFLSYLANDWIKKSNDVSPNFNINQFLTDPIVLRMSQNLLQRNLNEVVLTEPAMKLVFVNFLSVLMNDKDDKYPGIEQRVKKMDTVLLNPQYAGALLREFRLVNSKTFSVSKILDLVRQKNPALPSLAGEMTGDAP